MSLTASGVPGGSAALDPKYDAEEFDFQGPTPGTKFIMNHGPSGLDIYLLTIAPDGLSVSVVGTKIALNTG